MKSAPQKRVHYIAAALLGGATLLSSCDDESNVQTTLPTGNVAVFSLGFGLLPAPNDILGLTGFDGTLNVPNEDDLDPVNSINSLDGWSTTAHLDIAFFRALDPASLSVGSTGSVRVFEVAVVPGLAPIGGPVAAVVSELDGTVMDIEVASEDAQARTLRLIPTAPLNPEASYMVLVTDGVTDTDGVPAQRSLEFELLTGPTIDPDDEEIGALAPVQPFIQSMLGAAVAFDAGLDPDTVVLSLTFTTQTVRDVKDAMNSVAQGNEAAVIAALDASPVVTVDDATPDPNGVGSFGAFALIGTTGTLAGSPADLANIYAGTFTLPYYLDAPANANDPTPLLTRMQARYERVTVDGSPDTERNLTALNPLPEIKSSQTVPVLITAPKTAKPAGGWPVVMFQHGIGGDRANLLGIADALAGAGYVAVSIDLPLHGIDPADPTLGALSVGFAYDGTLSERTFGVDLLTLDSVPGPDGDVDASGASYINLTSLQTSRDNIRQAAGDLMAVINNLPVLDFDGTVNVDVDVTDVHFIGHSLGGIVGTVFAPFGVATPGVSLNTVTLGMPGGGIPKLLLGSDTFGPTLKVGLAAAFDPTLDVTDLPAVGAVLGSLEYAAFIQEYTLAAQQTVDSSDPINLGPILTATGVPTFLIEVQGDTVVPNNVLDEVNQVPDAPLAGTDPMIAAMGLDKLTGDVTGSPQQRWVLFTEGNHGSLLVPGTTTEEIAAFTEMQAQVISFLLSGGNSIDTTDTSVFDTSL
jgi:pimeloyl-ACP methyl ester carboxylesterase